MATATVRRRRARSSSRAEPVADVVSPGTTRRWRRTAACAAALAACAGAGPLQAQDAGPRRLAIVPTATLGQTVTDYHRTQAGDEPRSEAITTVGAGLRMTGRGERVQGYVDYTLTGLLYARDSQSNDLQNRLQASVLGELVERHLFVSAQASITQQPISALAVQTPDGVATSRNRTEVSTLALQPTLQGRLGTIADLKAALNLSATDTGGAQDTSDSTNAGATVSVSSATAGRLGWSVDASRQMVDFKTGRKTEDARLTLGLSYRPDVDWQFRLRGGVEENNYRVANGKERYDNWGAGLSWTPSPRTKLALDGDRRAFGHSHTLALEHRSHRTVWRYRDSQDVSRGSAGTVQTLVGAYDLFFSLYASQEPDPVLREQLVDGLLQRNNLQRDSLIAAGFLASAVTLQRRQELSMAIDGQRTSFLVSAFANRSSRVDTVSSGIDDVVGGNNLRQRGLSFTVAHRLTTTGALNLMASALRSSDYGGLRTDLRSVSATWSERLGARTNFSLGLRHSEFDATADPYTENAVTANLSLRF